MTVCGNLCQAASGLEAPTRHPTLGAIAGDQAALRTVTVQLQNEDHSAIVQTWKLRRARIVKHVSGPLHAQGNDVAIEEMVIAYERLEME